MLREAGHTVRGSVYVQLPEQARPWGEEAGEWSGAGEGLEVTAQGGRVPFRTDERVLGVDVLVAQPCECIRYH